MDWSDHAIVLSTRPFGETGAVAMLLTRAHGRHAGLVPGGRGKVARAALQPGNRLSVRWRGRLSEQLGQWSFETEASSGVQWLNDADRLAGLVALCAMCDLTLPEREPYPEIFDGCCAFLEGLSAEDWPALYVQWEVGLLGRLGYALDLDRCAATGTNDDLAYVSPRTGRAVSRDAGAPLADRLLPLPGFLRGGGPVTAADVQAGLRLTGHFLERHVLGPQSKPMPSARSRLVERLGA